MLEPCARTTGTHGSEGARRSNALGLPDRAIRGPVVTRKNARGSHNDDSARLAATVWTVTATAQMAGLNILTWLTAYLDACGRNNSKPLSGPELDRFLPWNADPEDLRAWAQPPPPPPPN